MKINVLTLFPQQIIDALNYSVTKKAQDIKALELNCVDIRDFANNKHNHVDDYAYGGGAGMIMQAEPIYQAYKSLNPDDNTKVIYLTPKGKIFNQQKAKELSKDNEIILLCGHYEGVDQRIIDEIVTDEISIGSYVLSGGEIATITIIDSITRLLPNVISEESLQEETFENGTMEYPQYTRPCEWKGRAVPDVLLSGNHAEIAKWRAENSEKIE